MDISNLLTMGAKLFQDKLGDGFDTNNVVGALKGLLTNGSGDLDIASLMSNLSGDGLGGIVSSWIGGGENGGIDASGIASLFGNEKIESFASALGIDSDSALSGLSEAVPAIIDQATGSGEGILDSLGVDSSSLLGAAKGFF